MIPAIWPVSVALETALALSRGGFRAFRRFLWADIVIQCGALTLADSGPAYQIYEPLATVAGLVALAPAVWEARGRRAIRRPLTLAAIAAVAAFLVLELPGYGLAASASWAATALFHSMAGIFLIAGMAVDGEARFHSAWLAGWLLADSLLFYLAPAMPVGYAVLWLNAAAWVLRLARVAATR